MRIRSQGSGIGDQMLSALDLARRIEVGELTPRAVFARCVETIAARDKEIGAFVVYLDVWERAVGAIEDPGLTAPALGGPLASSPLRGLPVAFKDIFATADLPTQYGSPIYAGYRPRADAAAVALTRRAGGVVIGKTVTTEMASMVPAGTRNPHNLAHTPGGSSSGSAAAVAAGMVPLAFGTQTAGSVIRPAAFCGVVGFKPSFGLIPRAGAKMLADRLDTIGTMARDVADAAFFAGVVAGRPALRDVAMPATPPRFGLYRTPMWQAAAPSTAAAIER